MTGTVTSALIFPTSHPLIYSEIRVWTLGGDLIYTLSGHTSFVYSLSVLPDGDIVSAGEDRTVRIWQGTLSGLLVRVNIPVSDRPR